MYKVFFKDKCIFFHEVLNNASFESLAYPFISENQLKECIELFALDTINNSMIFYHHDVEMMFNSFLTFFPIVEAGGGIVKNKSDELLFIFRQGCWDLPKGKLDLNEDIKMCAIREVQEECGIQQVNIIKKIKTTYHIFEKKHKWFIKKTTWFEMLYAGNDIPVPQLEEDISEVKWFKRNELEVSLSNTYSLIKDLVKDFLSENFDGK